MHRPRYCTVILLQLLLTGSLALAADWPQFRGPQRNGQSEETGLMKKWAEAGPKELWTADGLGEGWSSAAIANGSIYITGMENKMLSVDESISSKEKLVHELKIKIDNLSEEKLRLNKKHEYIDEQVKNFSYETHV